MATRPEPGELEAARVGAALQYEEGYRACLMCMVTILKQTMTTALRYPDMRTDLVACANALADDVHQRTVWLDQLPRRVWDNFNEVIHFLYDDTSLDQTPERYVGTILYGQDEVEAVRRLTISLDRLFERHGLKQTDAFYMASELWKVVQGEARSLSALLSVNDTANR